MEIIKSRDGRVLVLAVKGRLDAAWAEHLDAVITEEARAGSLRLRADLSGVVYLSSAGIGILVKAHQMLAGLGGSFTITQVSPAVRKVLELVGLYELLTGAAAPADDATSRLAMRLVETPHRAFQVSEADPQGPLTVRML